MKFWERVKKDLHLAMEEGVDLFKEGTATFTKEARRMANKGAATMREETRRMARLGRLRYQVYRLNQKAQTNFTEMGGKVYDLASKDLKRFKLNEGLKKLILENKEIERQVETLESEIRKLSKKKQKKAA